jgi:hypothetical protein
MYFFLDPLDSSSSSRSRIIAYPARNSTMTHSNSSYHGTGHPPSQFRIPVSYTEQMRKRTRSMSSGCFLDTIEPQTPTPPPPPTMMSSTGNGTDSRSLPRPGGHHQRPVYIRSSVQSKSKFNQYNGYTGKNGKTLPLPPIINGIGYTDYTTAGSPPLTPVPTPPPPATSKSLKHLDSFGRESKFDIKPSHMV